MKKGAAWRNRPEGDLIMSSTCEISPHEDFNRWQLNRSAQPTASRPPAYERSRASASGAAQGNGRARRGERLCRGERLLPEGSRSRMMARAVLVPLFCGFEKGTKARRWHG